ncbi:c-type cytochrome [Kaarinaea lacus]
MANKIIRNINILLIICSIVVIFSNGSVLAETGKKPDAEAIMLGKVLYEKHCQVCHQKDGVGQNDLPWGVRHPEYIPAMPLNEASHAWHHSDEQLAKTIMDGLPKRSMPAWRGVLSEKDAANLVAYIKSLWGPEILACQGPKHMSCM